MGKLLEFASFEEKKKFYTHIVINTNVEFDQYLNSFINEGSIWRGSSDAKHRLYTSLQRFWIQESLPKELSLVVKYLKSTIDFSKKWNNEFLNRYFANYGINDFSPYTVLSVLRHYDTPTPILDWSRNPLIALFFGSHETKPSFSDSAIDNYFSLYEIKSEHPYIKMNEKESTFEFCKQNESNIRDTHNLKEGENPDFIKKYYQARINNDDIFFEDIQRFPINTIEDKPTDTFQYLINNNHNITNQEGLFLLNLSPDLPLELAIRERMDQIGVKREIPKDKRLEEFKTRHTKNFICYDIHKSLRIHVLEKLKSKGIVEDYLFPNLNSLAKGCVDDFLKNL